MPKYFEGYCDGMIVFPDGNNDFGFGNIFKPLYQDKT